MADTLFDLGRLFESVGAQRERLRLSWAALSRQVGVATSTIRRFGESDDAEADGVLPRERQHCSPRIIDELKI